jgi:hypothetical protein
VPRRQRGVRRDARRRLVAASTVLALAYALPAHGQEARAGPWVPIGSRLDGLVGWTIAEGGLGRVDPLTRPYRLAAVRGAATAQDTTLLSPAGRRVFRWLSSELAATSDSTAVAAELGQAFYNNGRRDSFREGGRSGAGAMGGVWVSMVRGPLVAVLNPAFENRLKDDPEYTGKTDRIIAGRIQNGYLAATGSLGDIVFGRMARNWGPELFQGLQLSPSAYATDQLVGTVRMGRFELTTIAQRLDDYDTTLAATVTRWFLAHRLTVRAGKGVWLAFTETGVYGGPGRGFEPTFAAPLNLGMLSEVNEKRDVNLLWGAELHAPLGRRASFEAQGMIDDIQIDAGPGTNSRPWSGGFTFVVRGALPTFPIHASLGYTQVRSLTFRNSISPWDIYAVRGVGLGRGLADYDQLLLHLEARPNAAVRMAIDISYLRRGSGDFHLPFPTDSVLAGPGQGFLVQPARSTPGARLTGGLELPMGLLVNGEIGVTRTLAGRNEVIAATALRLRLDVLKRHSGGAFPGLEAGASRPWP